MNRSAELSFTRRTRTECVLKLLSVLKGEELAKEKLFQQVELTALEAALKDDLGRHQWLQNVINVVLNDGSSVSKRRLRMYVKCSLNNTLLNVKLLHYFIVESISLIKFFSPFRYNNEGRDIIFSPIEYREIRDEVNHIDQYNKKLKRQTDFLQAKYSKIVKMSNIDKDSHIITAELRMKTSFKELLKYTTDESSLKDPYEIVTKLKEKYNDYFKEFSYIDTDWVIDELTFASFTHGKDEVLNGFFKNCYLTLTRIKEKLDRAKRYCESLRMYINAHIKSDIVWRSEMSNLLKELDNCPKPLPNLVQFGKKVSSETIKWQTIEKLMDLSQKYRVYNEKIQSSIDNVKNLIDLAVKK